MKFGLLHLLLVSVDTSQITLKEIWPYESYIWNYGINYDCVFFCDRFLFAKKQLILLWNQTLFKEARKGFLLLYFFVKLWKIPKKKSKLEISFQLYVKDTYDVIALTMATRQVHKKVLELYFSYWKLPQKLSRWPFMYFFGENLPKFFNFLESDKKLSSRI